MFTSKQILAFAAVATLIATVMELFFAASRSEASESRRLYEAALWNSPASHSRPNSRSRPRRSFSACFSI